MAGSELRAGNVPDDAWHAAMPAGEDRTGAG